MTGRRRFTNALLTIRKNQLTKSVTVLALMVITGIIAVSCNKSKQTAESTVEEVGTVVTGDIKAGIEKHIADQVKRGDGYFLLPFEDRTLKLKLVRVHVEYLATLGPKEHFACVDLAGADGEFYDVDFFMAGDPGDMVVTETTVHKVNGKPLYLWRQAADKTWGRVPVDDASDELLGVINGHDEFEFSYVAHVPELDAPANMWIPLPESDDFQTVKVLSIEAPGKQKTIHDKQYGNRILHLALTPADGGGKIAIRFHVKRAEKGAYAGNAEEARRFLAPSAMVPITDELKEAAAKAVAGKAEPLMKARAIYDQVIEDMRYMKYGDGWGKGDAVYACSALYGNCTDFHAYFIGLARAAGIPARFAIGAAIPSERNEGGVDGYHCWAEFYADGKWWPVDVSEADKFSALSMYYFGHHPANRFEFSRGRDLIVTPEPASGPINFLAYPVLEIGGKPEKVPVEFSFKRRKDT